MHNKLLANKKIMIVVVSLLLVLCVSVIILVTSDSKETGGKDTDTRTEQNKEDADFKDDKDEADENDNSGLEVLKPDEILLEDSFDASGSWGDTQEPNTQTRDKNNTDKIDQTESENLYDGENMKNDGEDPGKDEDILEDDIIWGDIY